YVVEEFTPFYKANDGVTDLVKPGWTGPYFGADWGFSTDPDTLVKLWRDSTRLYLEYEAYGVGVSLNDIPALWSVVPDAKKHMIRADNSRPETIFHGNLLPFSKSQNKDVAPERLHYSIPARGD